MKRSLCFEKQSILLNLVSLVIVNISGNIKKNIYNVMFILNNSSLTTFYDSYFDPKERNIYLRAKLFYFRFTVARG